MRVRASVRMQVGADALVRADASRCRCKCESESTLLAGGALRPDLQSPSDSPLALSRHYLARRRIRRRNTAARCAQKHP